MIGPIHAVTAGAAAGNWFDTHHVSFLHMFHVAADGTDHSSYFMAGDSAEGDSLIPSNVVQVGTTDPGTAHLDLHLIGFWIRNRNIFYL